MASEYIIAADGRPLTIVGYACLFDTPITIDGRTEEFARDAFSPTLSRGAPAVRAFVDHRRDRESWASVHDGSLRLWQDALGLGFSAKIRNTVAGRAQARAVAGGRAGVSFQCRPLKTAETASGYIVKAAMLTEISLTGIPMYATAAWLSDSSLMDHMPDHALALRRQWAEPHHDTQALRKMARVVARLPRRAPASRPASSRPQTRTHATLRASAPLGMEDIFPAGFGFSSAELGKLAVLEATMRGAVKATEELRFERQRGRNRAWRQARRAA